jgi:ATP-dependent RNA helicase RhlE
MAAATQQVTGTIKWYNRKKGFGFATPDGGGEDVFIHHSALPRSLQTQIDSGDRIAFGVEQRPKGPSATNVSLLEETYTPPTLASDGKGFNGLGLHANLLRAVRRAGYVEPTPIQVQAIPYVLAGRDVMGAAQTGTGKTAAFALPILQRLSTTPVRGHGSNGHRRDRPVRVLVLSPTRELALQIGESFSTYGYFTDQANTVIYGGVGQNPQVQALQRGVDILVATPGRLLDLMGQGYVHLDRVEVLVLDEADRMLDMGFIHDVRRIVKAVPTKRQTLLFSATLTREILKLAGDILRDPIEVSISPEQPAVEAIEQAVYFVPKAKKRALLEHLLRDSAITRALVFSRTKHGANRIVKNLTKAGIHAEPIHGNKSQSARQRALKNFQAGKTRVLVATDVVARGIDVEDISHVIQFDLPNEPETYVHRIGRTGRAGAEGIALAFCAEDERPYLRDIEKLIRMRIPVIRENPLQA